MRLQPLSEPAIRKWVADTLGNDPDEAFVAECVAITGGNPFMARALLDEAAQIGLGADADAVRRLRTLAPREVTRHVAGRLQWLPSAADRLARAMSILGDAEPAVAARLARVPEPEVAGAAFMLESAGILKGGESFRFTHPIMRNAVAAALTPAERNRDHLAAAGVLAAWGAPADLVAEHLLATEPAGDEWVVRTLRTAAQHATGRQDYSSAATYLARALRESISRRMRAQVLRDFASADLRLDDAHRIEHLFAAVDLADDADEQVATALQLVPVLISAMRSREAIDLLTRLRADLADRADDDLLYRLDIETLSAAGATAQTWPLFNDLIGHLDDRRMAGAGTVRLRLYRAIRAMAGGVRVAGIAEYVEQLLDDPDPLFDDEDSEMQTPCLVGWTLVLCDRPIEAERWLVDTAGKAVERRFFLTERSSLALVALAQYGQGRIADAEHTADQVLGRTQPVFCAGASVSIAAAVSVHSRLDRGDVDGAQTIIRDCGFDGAIPRFVASVSALEARGRLRIMQERSAEGLADLEASRRRAETRLLSPALASWPYGAAALRQQGRRDDAMSWARTQLRQAKAVGVSREIGRALRVIGLLTGDDRGLEILREAVDVLADSPARVEYATALIDHGAALRRANQRTAARSQLKAGLALARECGASRLSDRAVEELNATGLRGRAFGKTGVLTASERRVADMAAFGMRNRDIALRLYVTVKTVEWHLSQVYHKLGVRSRTELGDALNGASEVPLVERA
jgi:DNA-binding CsgD family transcriptional regulator